MATDDALAEVLGTPKVTEKVKESDEGEALPDEEWLEQYCEVRKWPPGHDQVRQGRLAVPAHRPSVQCVGQRAGRWSSTPRVAASCPCGIS